MARRPFFSGNYQLGSNANAANLIAQAGAAQGQMFANMGKQIGDTIQQYQLNKQKRDESEAAFQGDMRRVMQDDPEQLASMQSDPVIGPTLKRIQEGKGTQKDFDKYNAYRAADKEATIEKLKLDNARTEQGMLKVQAKLEEQLADPRVKKALAEAKTAEAYGNYAGSMASAEYAAKIQDNALRSAQTEYYNAKSKAEKETDSYKPGQRVDIEGSSGNKVSFVWTGNSLQPLNDSISQKTIEEAIVRGVDPATMQVYLKDNYDYDEDTKLYTFKEGEGFFMGYGPKTGAGKKDPLMEQTITLLGLRSSFIDDDQPKTQNQKDSVKETPTITTQEEFDALPSGAIFIENGVEYKKP